MPSNLSIDHLPYVSVQGHCNLSYYECNVNSLSDIGEVPFAGPHCGWFYFFDTYCRFMHMERVNILRRIPAGGCAKPFGSEFIETSTSTTS